MGPQAARRPVRSRRMVQLPDEKNREVRKWPIGHIVQPASIRRFGRAWQVDDDRNEVNEAQQLFTTHEQYPLLHSVQYPDCIARIPIFSKRVGYKNYVISSARFNLSCVI